MNLYLPKISCLMVTANGRLDYVKRSIKCYTDQTYPNKELVIVNEGSKDYQRKIEDIIQANYVWLDGKYTLGSLRNISVALATGDIVCQWDDDDFCTPQRLVTQFNFMQRQKADVVYLSDQLHYYFEEKEIYWDDWRAYIGNNILEYSLIPGTLMAKKEIFKTIRYQPIKRKEDTELANKLAKTCNVALLSDVGYMHVYSHHGGNVFSYDHHKSISAMRARSREKIIKYKHQIERSIKYFGFEAKVMCRDGLVFIVP